MNKNVAKLKFIELYLLLDVRYTNITLWHHNYYDDPKGKFKMPTELNVHIRVPKTLALIIILAKKYFMFMV